MGPAASFENLGDFGHLPDHARMECGVCWTVYDPEMGDDYWQIEAGTAFSALPGHWRCPNCDAPRERFVRLEESKQEPEDDPAARLAAYYRHVDRTSMADLPIRNPALRVEVVDLSPWRGGHLAVLLTPWCLNLVYLPIDLAHQDWQGLKQGQSKSYAFPAGRFAFIGAHLDGLGPIQTCSLLSPMAEFEDQDSARATAACIRDALNDKQNLAPVDAGTALFVEPDRPGLDRRRFLHGQFTNSNGEPQ